MTLEASMGTLYASARLPIPTRLSERIYHLIRSTTDAAALCGWQPPHGWVVQLETLSPEIDSICHTCTTTQQLVDGTIAGLTEQKAELLEGLQRIQRLAKPLERSLRYMAATVDRTSEDEPLSLLRGASGERLPDLAADADRLLRLVEELAGG
jgi:hypothetical protein